MLMFLSACSTNSGLILRSAYNNIDIIIESRINSYADFTSQQRQWIERSVEDYHYWHRTHQLPQIEQLISTSINLLNEQQSLPKAVLDNYLDQARYLYQDAYLASPLFNAAPILATVSDEQVVQIATKMQENHEEFLKRRQEQNTNTTKIERFERFMNFFDIQLNSTQRQLVIQKMDLLIDNHQTNQKIVRQWQKQFIRLLEQRHEENFESLLEAHLKAFLIIFETKETREIREKNRQIVLETTQLVLNSFTPEQRTSLKNRLQQLQQDINRLITQDVTTDKKTSANNIFHIHS